MPTSSTKFRQGDSVLWKGKAASVVRAGEKKATICLQQRGIPVDDYKMLRVVSIAEIRKADHAD